MNAAVISLLWDLFVINDFIADIPDQSATLEPMRIALKARQMKNVERVKVIMTPSHVVIIRH